MKSTIYEIATKQRLRFALGKSKENHHGIFWIQVSDDGSIYLDLIDKPKQVISASKIALEPNNTYIPYDISAHTKVKDLDKLKQHKLSFHASGTVHSIERMYGTTLRDLDKTITLCNMIFKDIKSFQPMKDKSTYNNLVLNYDFEDGYPIVCTIKVIPYDSIETLKEVELAVRYQFSTILLFPYLKDIRPFAVQVIFYHNNQATNPPYNAIMWLASDYKTKAEQEEFSHS